jgi:hypothetical protein
MRRLSTVGPSRREGASQFAIFSFKSDIVDVDRGDVRRFLALRVALSRPLRRLKRR